MITPPRLDFGGHSLLHHGPRSIGRGAKGVQTHVDPTRPRAPVDLRHQLAAPSQSITIDPGAFTDPAQPFRRLSRVAPSPAAKIEPDLVLERREPSSQRTDDAGG